LLLAACGAEAPVDSAPTAEDLGSVSEALTTTYEAESALLSGPKVSTAHAGYTGSGFADYQNASGDFIEWTVSAAAAGQQTLTFRYANGGTTSRPLQLKVGGTVVNASLAFPPTGGWGVWKTVSTTVSLAAGSNKIRATAIGSSGGDVDNLQVTPVSDPLLAVKKTAGCGLAAPQATGTFVTYTMQTSGTKAADCADKLNGAPVCGPWSLTREYAVWLPAGYDPNEAYPLVFQLTGCSGGSTNVYTLDDGTGPGVGNSVIRVGLKPPPNSVGSVTNPNQGCYDDREGDDSVDFVFYQKLRDTLKSQLCYDENRVFATGYSSGSLMANELACKFAGSASYALRGIGSVAGGVPVAQYMPTCSGKPSAGMWIHDTTDNTTLFSGTKDAINRQLVTNGCSNTNYDTAQFVNYPINGSIAQDTCKQIQGCPSLYPLVVCATSGQGHNTQDNLANPGFSKFFSSFSQAPLAN
jgi:poly(3-hydroxybutyrate) depolymerase